MAEIITATFQDGAFVPEKMPALPAGTRVRLTIEQVEQTDVDSPSLASAGVTPFVAACEKIGLKSGLRLTRDQLHERD